MKRITIHALITAISITVFACSDSLSSADDSDPNAIDIACQYQGEEYGINGLLICEEATSNAANLQERKTECEEDGGVWVNACPSGEKATCINDEDEKDVLLKIYADNFTCGDFMLKNADGSESIISKGGACGPFKHTENSPISLCFEFPEFPTGTVRLGCAELEIPFLNECQNNADLVCYTPEEGMFTHFYGEAISSFTCKDFEMEEL
jgi:hypothetical protein